MDSMKRTLASVYDYWFGTAGLPTHLPEDKKGIWFTQSDATDTYIRERFLEAVRQAAVIDWDLDALSKEEQVAVVVLLDQFPRNLFRGGEEAFAYDPRALHVARQLLRRGLSHFGLIEQMFIAIPFEHSEDISDQDI